MLLKCVPSLQAWSYAWAAFFRKFGLTAFFSLFENYLVAYVELTLEDAARGNMILGCASMVGVVATIVTYYLKYSRLASHSLTCIVIGLIMISLTAVHSQVIIIFNFFKIDFKYNISSKKIFLFNLFSGMAVKAGAIVHKAVPNYLVYR